MDKILLLLIKKNSVAKRAKSDATNSRFIICINQKNKYYIIYKSQNQNQYQYDFYHTKKITKHYF